MQLGEHEVVGEISRGGMGVVYKARDPLGREVAIKVLLSGKRATDNQRGRFKREAQALGRLRHANIVTVHSAGETKDTPFIVMDLVEGESLQTLLEREGILAPERAARIALQVARALEYAHSCSVLHRDIKPDNVLMTPEGQPVLTDFGLAKVVDPSMSEAGRLSKSGAMYGTPGYWSPEQRRGQIAEMGPRTDVYGVGAMLYALLTGGPPHGADVFSSQPGELPPPPSRFEPKVQQALDAICLRCLAVAPADRFGSMTLLADALEGYLRDPRARAPGEGLSAGVLVPAVGAVLLLAGVLAFVLAAPADAPSAVATDPVPASPAEPPAHSPPAAAPEAEPAPPPTPTVNLPEDAELPEGVLEVLAVAERSRVGGRWADAQRDYERALATLGDHAHTRRGRDVVKQVVAAYVEEGTLLAGNTPDNRVFSSSWIEARDVVSVAQQHKLAYPGDYPGAVACFDRVLELDPQNTRAYRNRSAAHYLLRGRVDDAIADLDAALAIDPRDAEAYYRRGAIRALQTLPGAKADLLRARELNPSDLRVRKSLAALRPVKKP